MNYNLDEMCIQNGSMVTSNAGNVFTILPLEGKFGGEVCVDQGTTNLLNNRLFTTNLSSWSNASWTSMTWNNIPNPVSGQNGAMNLIQTGNSTCFMNQTGFPLTSTDILSTTMYFQLVSGNPANISIGGVGYYSGGGYNDYTWKNTGSTLTLLPNNVYKLTQPNITFDTTKTTTTYDFRISSISGNPIQINVFAVQLEKKPWATPFVDGTRAWGKLYYPPTLISPNSFSISMWINAPFIHQTQSPNYGSNTSNNGIEGSWWNPIIELTPLSNRGVVGASFVIGPNTSPYNSRLFMYLNGGSGVYGTTSLQNNTWYHYMVTFDGSKYNTYLNGSLESSYVTSSVATLYSDTVLMVGGGYMGAPNLIISDLCIDNYPRPAEDAMALYLSNKRLYNPYDYRGYAY